jgi:dihydrofolate reductase
MSANGRITKGDEPNVHDWSSSEDSQHFIDLRDNADVVVIDRTTYELVQPELEAGKLRVVLTHHPETYVDQVVPGQLEFTSEPVAELVKRLHEAGKQRLLMAGGRHVSAEFLAAGIVDDIYLTYEPLLFSQGTTMLADESWLEVSLRLQSVKQLNERGTLLAHYTVDRGEVVA